MRMDVKPPLGVVVGTSVRRFSAWSRLVHAILAVSVYGLVLTGMPLKYPHAFWARPLMSAWGGLHLAGVFHRAFALMLISVGAMHLGGVAVAALGRRVPRLLGPDSILPLPQDVRDLSRYLKFLRGKGSRPEFGRFTYWEKFDYFAVFWGLVIIGGSGLVMWFPEVVARYLPGWAVNVALIVHSDEALLATGFLFAVHFFNTHLRPETFPLDPAIFSGTVPEEEVKERWPGWYRRLQESGELSKRSVAGSRLGSRPARTMGIALLSLGILILSLVMSAAIAEAWSQLSSVLR